MKKKEPIKDIDCETECALLRYLQRFEVYQSGAGRAVYCVPGWVLCQFDLDVEFTKDFAVKVPFGPEGLNQTLQEIKFFLENCESDLLAKIYYKGAFLEIMEWVEYTYDLRGIYIDLNADEHAIAKQILLESYEFDDTDEQGALEAARLIRSLASEFDFEEEELQCGVTKDGRWVCYDYGIEADCDDAMFYCSDLCDVFAYHPSKMLEYLDRLCDVLYGEDNLEHIMRFF